MKVVDLRLQCSRALQTLVTLRRNSSVKVYVQYSRNITFPARVSLSQLKGDLLPRSNRSRSFSLGSAWKAEKSAAHSDGDPSPETLRKRKKSRAAPGTTSLQRVAIEAQTSRYGLRPPQASGSQVPSQAKVGDVPY